MRRVKKFVEQKRRETEEQITKQQTPTAVDEPFVHFLQGRLEAFTVLSHYIDRLEEEDKLLNGAGSAFSPQG
jgi:hypothetical protein